MPSYLKFLSGAVLGLGILALHADQVTPVPPAAPAPAPATAPAPAPGPKLALTAAGVEIDTGTEKFTLPIPGLQKNSGGNVAGTVTMAADGKSLVDKFANGMQLTMALEPDGKTVTYEYTAPTNDVRGLAMNLDIPIEYGNGGKYALGQGDMKPFPAQKGKDEVVDKGDSGMFRLQSASGSGFGMKMPSGWNKLQDDRQFNGSKFEEQYLYLFATYNGQTFFAISFGDTDPKALAAITAPTPSIPPPPKPVVKKLVDQFGQPLGKDFPGKIASEDDLKNDIAADKAYYDSLTPPATDIYGGLPDSGAKYNLKKTGFFHIENIYTGTEDIQKLTKADADKLTHSVLVDPAGNLFFELGLCPIAPISDYTLTGGRRDAFEWLPSTPEEKAQYKSSFQGGYEPIFSFYRANVIKKYGKPFDDEEQSGIAVDRLRKWGFNAEGAFGEESKTMAAMNLPYTTFVPIGLPVVSGDSKVPDPFTDDAEKKMDEAMTKGLDPHVSDPLIIGFYLGNEQHFEDLPHLIPTLKGSKVGAKKRLVQMLQEKYKDIAKFNDAWQPKTPAQSFDELVDTPLSITTQAASDDMKDFQDLFTDAYYGLVAKVFHKHDPNHLLIGSRWQPGTANSKVLLKNAGKYMDVISVNYYTYGIEKDFLQKIHDLTGKPLLMSEWHYGSGSDSAAGGAAKSVKSQTERGMAYRNYVETVATVPYVIGSEWFSYLDQPATGRFFEGYNGESGNIGLINVADRPYKLALAEMMKTNYAIYPIVLGQQPPFHYDDPKFNIGPGGGRKEVDAPMALPGMKIDGQASDWPGRPGEHLSKGNLVLGADAGTLEGDFKLCWDAENLYLFVQVADNTPMINPNTGDKIWEGDALELFIGPDNIDEGGELAFTDRQILLSCSKETGSVQYHIGGAPTTAKINMEVVKNVTGDGYAVEAAIPWAALNMKPEEGKEFLFDIGIDDDTGRGRSRQLMWNGISRNSGDRSKWGIAKLVK
jgi:hypothetical protein